jgi:hypothetical protein
MTPHRSAVRDRALTTLAVGFLALDALLLLYSGLSLGRVWLTVGGGLCALAAVLVVAGWRRYRRVLTELDAARREMRAEVESIRDLLHSKHLDN